MYSVYVQTHLAVSNFIALHASHLFSRISCSAEEKSEIMSSCQ